MFYYLNGKLALTEPGIAVIDCGGVGYKLFVSNATMAKLTSIGSNTKLYVYTSIREDAVELFGFYTLDELNQFKLLIGVSGVGPKIALAIISSLGVERIVRAISGGNVKLLSAAPGVGKKTAERIIVDLKDKMSIVSLSGEDEDETFTTSDSNVYSETIEALMTLGYPRRECVNILKGCKGETVEELMREALKKIGGMM